jgi:diacylglycerol kinase (ATP)
MKWLIIRNPNAAGGKSMKLWPSIREQFLSEGLEFDDVCTTNPMEAVHLAREAIAKGYRKIAAMGGDGTVNEVVNGIMSQSYCDSKEILFTQIPIGTGNDWSRTMGIPKKIKELAGFLKHAKEEYQDLGLLTWHNNKGKEQQRYFVNIAGMGFDAFVGVIANKNKAEGKSGVLSYIKALLSGLYQYKVQKVNVKIDSQDKGDFELFSLAVGICNYSGGGMKQCPDASYNDGILDLTLIEKINKWKVVFNILRLYSGSFVKNKEVHQYKGQYIEIKTNENTLLEVDGEVIGSGTAEFSLLPSVLKVLVNK